ncbi:MAG TPA: ATP-binding protein [Candidatus Bacteroides avicola]|uniref:ATP-binding protein n=1 Tax=Candidatus Bacteroides avicola TaxID=2838468 RepID=A0A9D2HZC6_9BACE|nr:ATP-binding protein [Candidatus Bacteroides avicola]
MIPVIRRYPVGIQTFSELRTKNYLYVDKTEYVYRMAHGDAKYVFLSRPRRFGKSLLTSTLRSYFEGKKELFEGLAIEKLETEWITYPVLHFDMSLGKHMDREQLENYLHFQLSGQENKFGISTNLKDSNIRLTNLIQCVYKQTGKQVVILIDEYDAPLLDVVHEDKDLPLLHNVMRNFYSPLKACDPYLRFVFLTGITKFSQLSIFSELNNIDNISMDERYAAVCGITEEEMRCQMRGDIERLGNRLQLNFEDTFARLKANYDGYHFTWPSPDVYNPYSLMNALSDGKVDSYWFGSGTPTYLIEMLRKFGMGAIQLGGTVEAERKDFDAPTERLTSVIPLLYQSGYFTIKDGDPVLGTYTLGIPNREVRIGLMQSLAPYYLTPDTLPTSSAVITMARCLYRDDMEGALQAMQAFLGTIPYAANTDYEGHYQQVLYVIFSLLGYYVDLEVRTPRGRVDVVMRTRSTLYVMELKLDKRVDDAMRQIDLRNYPERFALCGLPVVKVGIVFDSNEHTLGEWKIEKGL